MDGVSKLSKVIENDGHSLLSHLTFAHQKVEIPGPYIGRWSIRSIGSRVYFRRYRRQGADLGIVNFSFADDCVDLGEITSFSAHDEFVIGT
jgi:hypothetical protein